MRSLTTATALLLILGFQSASAQFAGTYTVGGASPDFATFQEAADSLMAVGVSGPVDVLVRPGVYTSPDSAERVLNISQEITGGSNTSRVRFALDVSAGAEQTNVILRRYSGVREAGFVVNLLSSHVTVEGFSIELSDSTAAIREIPSIVFIGAVSDAVLDNLVINGLDRRAGICVDMAAIGADVVVTDNRIADCVASIHANSTNTPDRLLVQGNHLSGMSAVPARAPQYGIHVRALGAADIVVADNVLDYRGGRGETGIFVYGDGPLNRLRVERNVVFGFDVGTFNFGIAGPILSVENAPGGLIANNFLSGNAARTVGANLRTGIFGDTLTFVNNTVRVGGAGCSALVIPRDDRFETYVRVLNNILISEGHCEGFSYTHMVVSYTTDAEIDYNVHTTVSPTFAADQSGSYPNIAAWQSAGFGSHSTFKRPEFVDDVADLHLFGASVGDTDLIGTPLPEVPFDIDRQPRDGALPYVGADEAAPFPEGQPVARDDNFRVFEETPTTLDVLTNDFDDQPLTITSLATAGTLGSVSISPDGLSVEYDPPIAFVGRDRFSYTVRDTDGLPEDGTVTVDVIAKPADLVVSNIVLPPDAFSGETLSFEFSVTNNGPGATRAPVWFDRVVLSTTPDESGRVLESSVRNPTFLDAGESYTTVSSLEIPDGLAGTHYLVLRTDWLANQEESNEDNNARVSGSIVQITLTPPPDLQVIAVSAPSTAFSGTTISVSYTVSNEGVGPTATASWIDAIVGIDSDDNSTTLGTFSREGALSPGESYSEDVNVQIPNAISGRYVVIVETDPRAGNDVTGRVFENLLEGNNSRNDSLDVTLSPPPDLVPISISAPASALAGQPIPVSWTVENQGAGTPFESGWSDRVYLSIDQILSTDTDILLGSARFDSPPAAGSSYNGAAGSRIPNGIAGTFYLILVGDANGEIFEHTFEDNNVLSSTSTVEVTVPPSPDLVVSSVTAPAEATAGEEVFVAWTVSNVGEAATVGRWVDRVYISSNANYVPGTGTEVGSRVCDPCSLDVGASYSTGLEVATSVDLPGGPYYLHVVTDADDALYEHQAEEDNGGSSSEITLAEYPPVDLRVTIVSVSPDTVDAGAPITVNWLVENSGTGTTLSSRWTDRVYLSGDEQLDPTTDQLLAERSRLQPLGGGERYARTSIVPTPDIVSGVFFLIVETDALNQAREENDENNTFASPSFVIETVPPPDLKPVSFLAPVEAAAGQPITVSWTVQNQGTGATVDPSWFDGIYLSDLSTLTPAARRIGTTERTGVLDPDSSYTDSTEVVIPAFASGSQFLLFQTDSGGDVFEGSRESNNRAAAQISIILNDPSDLVVTSVTAPPTAVPGEEITVEYTVTNLGTFEARGFVIDAAYVSTDDEWDIEDPLVGIIGDQLVLAPGASQKRSMTIDVGRTFSEAVGQIADELPGVVPGDYRILVRSDVRNAIRETEDENNVTAAPTMTGVTMDALTLDTPANFGIVTDQRKYFALTVGSGEDLRLTLTGDNPQLANDIYVALERAPGPEDFDFGPSAPNEANQEVFVPTTQAGTYYILVQRRDLGAGTEQVNLLAEVMGFTILSITPDEGGEGGRVTTTIRGARFDTSTIFRLEGAGVDPVEGSVLERISSNEARVRWSLTSVPVAAYEVVASDESSQARIPFLVVPRSELLVDVQESGSEQLRERRPGRFSYVVRNVSNVNVPYLEATVIVPDGLTIQELVVEGEVQTEGEVNRRILRYLEDASGVKGELDLNTLPDDFRAYADELGDTVTVIPLRAVDVGPGEQFSASFVASGFVAGDDVPVTFRYSALNVNEFAPRVCSAIESGRLSSYEVETLSAEEVAYLDDSRSYVSDMLDFLSDIRYIEATDKSEIEQICLSQSTSTPAMQVAQPGPAVLTIPDGHAKTNSGALLERCRAYQEASCWFFGKLECTLVSKHFGEPFGVFIRVLGSNIPIPGLGPVGWVCEKVWDVICKPFGDVMCRVILQALDPNDIIGPEGFGDDRWIAFDDPLPYTIRFENDPVKATAAAQEVFVTQQLDSTLDWRSFRLGEFGFGEYRFQVPENSAFYQTRIDVRDSLNLFVDFTAGIDITTGEAFWRFESIDPLTGELPWFDGFLPPNDTLGRGTGEGFVTYSIKPKATAQTREIVNAEARIIFDFNDPIDTPPIFNTIDAEPPMSMVQPLSAVTDTSNFPVTWSLDDFGGSDARGFTLYASENGEPFEVYRSGIADTSAIFVGDYEKDYSFFVVATDNTGNAEALKSESEASTAVVRPVGIEDQELPKEFALYQNYPNPFNPTTTIPFDIAKAGDVEITVYDVIGRRVLRADQGALTPGRYRAAFNLSHLASGVYVYRIRVRGESRKLFEAVNKFVLVK